MGRVLIADDEETFLFSTADLLRKEGYICDCAVDSDTAKRLLVENQYDVMIADIRMPGNTDLEFIHELPNIAEGLPIILVTAYPSLKSAIQSVRLPVIAYLVKPLDVGELIGHIRASAERSKVRRAVGIARQQLQSWRKELDNIEKLADAKEDHATFVPVDAYLTLTLQNIVESLSGLRTLTESIADISGEQQVCRLLNCPRATRLNEGLKETIRVLEKTKRSFKSKELGELRRRLESLLDNEEE